MNSAVAVTENSHTGSAALEPRKAAARSRVSNGTDVLPDVDGRSAIARRYRDIVAAILVDQGGEAQCSESRKQLIRRFAAAAVLAEQLESKLANGEQIDIAEHATLASTLVRLAARIGIDRVPRDIGGMTLGDLMRAGIGEQTGAEGADPDGAPISPSESQIRENEGAATSLAAAAASESSGLLKAAVTTSSGEGK